MVQRLKPWAIGAQLDAIALMQKHPAVKVLDVRLLHDGRDEGQELGELETMDSQMAVINSFSMDMQKTMLALAVAPDAAEQTERLIKLYLAGNETAFQSYFAELYKDAPELRKVFQKEMLDVRNVHMVDRILEEITKKPERSCFFAVGAFHLEGKTGLPTLLRAKDYTVERLNGKGEVVPDKKPAESKPLRKAS